MSDHAIAALAAFNASGSENVLVLGRTADGKLKLVTSFPEMNSEPLKALLVDAMTHLSISPSQYAGREWVAQH